jgi:hypothetical protein
VDYCSLSASERRREWAFGLLIIIGTWLILAWTTSGIPIVWDEGEYLFRADEVASWFRLLLSIHHPQGGLHAFSDAVIQDHWPFVISVEGHPSWFVVPIVIGKALLSGALSPLTAARVGPITVFSLACGVVACRLKRAYGTVAAVAAPIAMLTLPRLFAEAHFATQDGQLTAWWLMLWAADASPERGARTALPTGVLLGLTCATKFTGWLAAFPIVLTGLVKRPREVRRLLIILPVALFTFYVVNPPLWHAPLRRLVTHVYLNLNRPDVHLPGVVQASRLPDMWAGHQRPIVRLRDYLVGSMRYGGEHPYAPWYNTIAWWLVATPVLTLVLGIIGMRHSIRRRAAMDPGTQPVRVGNWVIESPSLALLLHWATLMIVRALPGMPANDGIRLILPAFGFWSIFAGIGALRVWNGASRLAHWPRRAVGASLLAACVATAMNVGRYYPQMLSHYSLLVGGVRGAARLGFEPTYWWDALDGDVLDWLNSHTEPSAAVAFSFPADLNLDLLRSWGRLRTDVTDPGWGTSFKWYVLQNRSNALTAVDHALMCCERPAYTKYAGWHPHGVPADLDVPLLLVFSYGQYRAAAAKATRSELPSGAPVPKKAGY